MLLLLKLCVQIGQIGELISSLNSVPVSVIKYVLLESVRIGFGNFPWRIIIRQVLSNLSGIDTHK